MTYYILAESATVIEKIYDLQPSMMPSKHPYSSGAPWQQKQLSSSACWYLSSIASSAKSLASFPWMVTYSQTSSSSFSWILLAKMLWQNQTVGALNIWKPIEACLWHFCPFFNKLTMQCYQPGKSHPLLFGNYFCHSNHWCCNLQPQWSMIICQTKPENLFSIETLCFWAYQNSIFWNDESTILQCTMCNYHE